MANVSCHLLEVKMPMFGRPGDDKPRLENHVAGAHEFCFGGLASHFNIYNIYVNDIKVNASSTGTKVTDLS